ncbi:MAG: hypothetical protein ACOC4C_03045 [Fibrobacterota bacterium]
MKIPFHLLLWIIATITMVYGQTKETRNYFTGFSFSYNQRDAYFIFDDISQQQKLLHEPVILWGVFLGKSYNIGKRFGFQLVGSFDLGNSDDGLFSESAFLSDKYEVKYRYLRLGFRPDLQYFLPHQNNIHPYLHAGGGIEYVRLDEHFFFADRNQEVSFSDLESIESRTWTFSLHGGVGSSLISRKDWKLGLAYWFMYSNPVNTTVSRDLPISTVHYHERFFSHMVQVVFHFRLLES